MKLRVAAAAASKYHVLYAQIGDVCTFCISAAAPGSSSLMRYIGEKGIGNLSDKTNTRAK